MQSPKAGNFAFAVFMLAAASTSSLATDLFVAPSGDDGASGSQAAPFKTLGGAKAAVRTLLQAPGDPITVYLRQGTYYLDSALVFTPEDAGSPTRLVKYSNYQNEKAILSGGIKVTPAWTTSSGQIKVATIAPNLKVDQLFLNGARQILARYPNFDSTKVILDGYAADCIGTARVAKWSNPTEGPGYVRGLHGNMWGGNSFTITAKNADNTVTLKWSGDNNQGNTLHPTYRMVENIFEELDAPGEWYYSKPTGKLYFYPPAGTDLNTATIELASQDEIIRITGTTAAKVKYLDFNGLTFTHTYRTLFSKPYEGLLRGDWAIARTGTIYIENSENVRIENCSFDQIGGNGVFISGYNRNHVIVNNVFTDAGASCVAIVGRPSAVRCPTSTCTDKTPGPLTNEYPTFITVDNNTMDHFGRFEKQTAGVDISMSQSDTVRHNTISRCPRAGINFTDGCWGGHMIEYNWVYKAVLETQDHGPLNAWGRDRNFIWSTDTSATELDAVLATTIHDNRFEAAPPLFGIDLDDGASNYNVYNNLTIGVGLKLWHTRHNRYVNNVLVNGGLTEFHDTWANSNHYFAHNITSGPDIYSFCCFVDMSAGGIPTEVKQRVQKVDSNCIYSNGNQPIFVQWTQRNTVVSNWTQWLAAGLDAHSKLADPMFTDSAKGDYSVKPNSPCLDIGFKNFPMDQFGVLAKSTTALRAPRMNGPQGFASSGFEVRYSAGRLFISRQGNYRVTVTTPLGETLGVFEGNGNGSFAFRPRQTGTSVCVAMIRSAQGLEMRKFLIL